MSLMAEKIGASGESFKWWICWAKVLLGIPMALSAVEWQIVPAEGRWTKMPPQDIESVYFNRVETPIPRIWNGERAALAYSYVETAPGSVAVDWHAARIACAGLSDLKADPRNWGVTGADTKPALAFPEVYGVTRDLRPVKGDLSAHDDLLPFVAVIGGNSEDGYCGYLVGFDTDVRVRFRRCCDRVELAAVQGNARQFALKCDGTHIAAFTRAMARPALASLVVQLAADYRTGMHPDLLLAVLCEYVSDDKKWNVPATDWGGYLKKRFAVRAALLTDPRLQSAFENGVFFYTRRNPAWNHCILQYAGWRQRPGGDLLVLEEPGRSMRTRSLTEGKFPRGAFVEPRLSYDAKKVVFSFVATEDPLSPRCVRRNDLEGDHHYNHIWEMNVDGSGLRQLTSGTFDDMMPCYLPDGGIAFMSTRRRSMSRCFWWGYGDRWQSHTLFRMNGDGSCIQQLSCNDVCEWHPAVDNDGRIVFSRWDYIDRNAVTHQNLWAMRPDGTAPMSPWGNETAEPHCTFQLAAVPGSRKIAAIASAHHAITGGPLILIDPEVDDKSEAAVTHVTPGRYPECQALVTDWYNSPYPLGEDLFLIAYSREPLPFEPMRPGADHSLGLYVLDAQGHRELLYRNGLTGAAAPQPLVARPAPPVIASRIDKTLAEKGLGEVFVADVYKGLTNAAPRSLKTIRVVQVFPKTTLSVNYPAIGGGGEENARAVLGTARVEEDGSARFFIPAMKAVYFQVLDKDGMAWRTMRSSTSVMPGERMSCVGCHESKREASEAERRIAQALKRPAQTLDPTPESGRPWGYVENVQPIFDRKCVSCHGGEQPAAGISLERAIDLKTEPDYWRPQAKHAEFVKSFTSLCWTRDAKGRLVRRRAKDGREMIACFKARDNIQTTPEGPGVNALGSGLIAHLRAGKHAARVTPEELRMIATWIDLNATFYGCYEEPNLSKQLKGEPIPPPDNF